MKTQRQQQYFAYIWSNKNYRLSIFLAVAALIWLASGFVGSSQEVDATGPTPEAKKMRVKARYLDVQSYQPVIHVRARTQANRQVSLRSELSGKVVALPVTEGQAVKKGAIICELAVDDRQLSYLETQSSVAQAQLEYDGSQRLKTGGYQSGTAIAAAKARLDSAKAALLRSKLNLDKVKIRAPFDGVIDRHSVDVGDFMERGDECGLLMDLDPMIISGRLSETEVSRVNIGDKAQGLLLTGQRVEGEVSLVGYGSDSITRTFPVEVSVDNASLTLRSGITTDLVVPTASVAAHLISSSLLSLDDEGRVGVRILSEDYSVKFALVSLIGDHPQGVWVSGLPERVLIVTVGQEYLSEGEVVDVVFEQTDAAGSVNATTAAGLVAEPAQGAQVGGTESL